MKFEELLKEFNVPIAPSSHHHARSGWIQFDCPFCGRDSGNYHMGYSIDNNYTNCWRCGYHSLLQVIYEISSLSVSKCRQLLKELETETGVVEEIETGIYKPPIGISSLSLAHETYLRERGFSPTELVRLWNIQGIGISPTLSWRIFIPIYYKGKEVSWTTRSISRAKNITRYISAAPEEESVFHKTLLYGEDYARTSIIITEGPFDVWRIGPGAVATFGVGYSQAQVEKMIKYPVRAVCFDNEPEAQMRARELANNLEVFPGRTFLIKLDSKDLGEASEKEIKTLRKEILEYYYKV